ncbi:MAG: nitrogenase component 1 [Treponema sp.]|jgi:nitrogenase molybdenum-iron protein alpha chain|nr:nitrogenase component 1 [Treponema sp.]
MPAFLENTVISREKRFFTLSAYQGKIRDLQNEWTVPEPHQRIRTLSQANSDDILEALRLLSTIPEAVVVIHGVIGCGAACLDFYQGSSGVWYSTALHERDTILGGDEKLRRVLERAYREQHPRAIFIVGTPVVAINNDDINSVILELEAEFDTRIISIPSDGFKSKVAVNGIDIVLHAIGKYLVDTPTGGNAAPGEDFVNLIAVSENRRGVDALVRLLTSIGCNAHGIPRFSPLSRIARAGEAKASIAINDSRADVFLRGLAEKTGVVFAESRTPVGITATSAWLLTLGKLIHREEAAQERINTETKKWRPVFSKKPLAGKRFFISLPAEEAAETALFLEALGADITGISIDAADETNREALTRLSGDLFVHVGNGQPFELANMVSKDPPDFYITGNGSAAWALEFGVLPVALEYQTLYGYEGAAELLQSIQAAGTRRGFADYLFANPRHPYKASWLKKNANWHIKQEVT